MRNAFGQDIPTLRTILADSSIEAVVREMFNFTLRHVGGDVEQTTKIVEQTLHLARTSGSLAAYERDTYQFLTREGITQAFPRSLAQRTKLIGEQIKPYLLESSVMDIGCGDGKVGEELARQGYQVTLADVFQHQHISETRLPFSLTTQAGVLPFEDWQFDNALLIYVCHHSDDPIKTIQEARRVTRVGGRIIAMESVYGVPPDQLIPPQRETAQRFLGLSPEQQRLTNIFFDHFWNRVFMYSEDPTGKINVPFNFNTPEGWKKLFAEQGLQEIRRLYLGIDQPTVPEYHTLHVLRVM